MAKYLIGYIDEQEGERMDFAGLMTEDVGLFDVEFFNVDDSTNLEDLVAEILNSKIDCIVVDYHLSEIGVQFEGSEIIEHLHRIKPHFPKIIYTAKEDKVIPEVENEIIYMINDKSIKGDEDRRRNFRQKIRALIENYQEEVSKTHERLEVLTAKKKQEDLSLEEENELFSRKQFLLELDRRVIELPEILNSNDYLNELKEANQQVSEILSKIKNA